jgi:hypothetical protein
MVLEAQYQSYLSAPLSAPGVKAMPLLDAVANHHHLSDASAA